MPKYRTKTLSTEQIMLNSNKNKFMFPQYQRGEVWTLEKQQCLISSILKGYPIPPIYIQELPDGKYQGKDEVVDGRQRITTVLKFMTNKFTVTEQYADFFVKFPYTYSNLTPRSRSRFEDYQFNVIKLKSKVTPAEKFDLFKRVQNGEEHSNGELLNALSACNDLVQLMQFCWKKASETIPLRSAKRMENIEILGFCVYRYCTGKWPKSFNEMQKQMCNRFGKKNFNRQFMEKLRTTLRCFLLAFAQYSGNLTFNTSNKFVILLHFECWIGKSTPATQLWNYVREQNNNNNGNFVKYTGFKKLTHQKEFIEAYERRRVSFRQ